jgi:glyoxylase-like metal-dependent hydrolase (beta-lactamase superfamily II)
MERQIPVSDESVVRDGSPDDSSTEIRPDVAFQRLVLANVVFIGERNGPWVLVDAGVWGGAEAIVRGAEERFGSDARPEAIVMTHGHFDHVGALEELLERWSVPVYVHPLELPYFTGEASYPAPDPSVGGGIMAAMSRFFPSKPVDVGRWAVTLPSDGTVPVLAGWRAVHTPGHTRGHISLWRETDRMLVAGDAVITTAQESAYAVMTQRPELHGPPQYFTPDWSAAKSSVRRLAELRPEYLVTGHGPALAGVEMRTALENLARNFDEVAVPEQGRYVPER